MNSGSVSGQVPTIKCEDASPMDPEPTGGGIGGGSAYNLSVNVNNLGAVSSLLAAESAASTPRTPEILNSLIAMSNPMDQYNYNSNEKCPTPGYKSGSGDSNSSMSNGSSATSPASGTPPSVQKTCSDLIKAGLKLSIESKRKMSGSDTDTSFKRFKKEDSDDEYDSSHTLSNKGDGVRLTPEDEERRRRRRERNKIAATKCRLKKRERTVNLVTESEVLESQNIELKSQLKDLELQKRQLTDMLQLHNPCCTKNKGSPPPPATPSYNMIRPYDSPTTFPAAYESNSPYIRPESANILASSYTCITSLNESSIDTISSLDSTYITQPIAEGVYLRPDSVFSVPNTDAFITTDDQMQKVSNLLVIEPTDAEYYESDVTYGAPQCHVYPATPNDKYNGGCLV